MGREGRCERGRWGERGEMGREGDGEIGDGERERDGEREEMGREGV